jgi:hypothetical protein
MGIMPACRAWAQISRTGRTAPVANEIWLMQISLVLGVIASMS